MDEHEEQNMSVQIQNQPRGKGAGYYFILLITLVVVIGVGIFVLNPQPVSPFTDDLFGIERPETQSVSGDPASFDPLDAYSEVLAFAAGDADIEALRLVEIEAAFVRNDGTMDLTATYVPAPRTTYTFALEVPRPADAPPAGVPGSTSNEDWYQEITVEAFEPGQRRRVSRLGGNVNTTFYYVNQGMTRFAGEITNDYEPEIFISVPECSFVDLWEVAIEQGAPSDAVAQISYDEDGYMFNIVSEMVVRFNPDCTERSFP